jgi:hypothetical protein
MFQSVHRRSPQGVAVMHPGAQQNATRGRGYACRCSDASMHAYDERLGGGVKFLIQNVFQCRFIGVGGAASTSLQEYLNVAAFCMLKW